MLDLTGCCDSSCAGNNLSSPYGAFYVPPAPGQNPEAGADADGLSTAFHFRDDEAIVFVGSTPPESKYFGFTPYLTARGGRSVAASLSETLNNGVVNVNGASSPFGQEIAIVVAADQTTLTKVSASLVKSGIPAGAIHTMFFDPAIANFGFLPSTDTSASSSGSRCRRTRAPSTRTCRIPAGRSIG